MGNRGEQRRPKAIGFDGALDPFHVLDQPDPLDRERRLIHQGIEQTALIRREKWPGFVAVDADNADLAAPGVHRQEQALRARQRIGAAPGGAVAVPGPFAAISASSRLSSGG